MTHVATLLLLLAACAHRPRIIETWPVPGFPDLKLAFLLRPPAGKAHGPQLAALRGGVIVHESRRLFDVDFVQPRFLRFGERTLMLADHGAEDVWGMAVWSFEDGRIRDLGVLEVALPESDGGFTGGAAPSARVERRGDSYLVTIPGPLLLDPRGANERQVGHDMTFTLPAPP